MCLGKDEKARKEGVKGKEDEKARKKEIGRFVGKDENVCRKR